MNVLVADCGLYRAYTKMGAHPSNTLLGLPTTHTSTVMCIDLRAQFFILNHTAFPMQPLICGLEASFPGPIVIVFAPLNRGIL